MIDHLGTLYDYATTIVPIQTGVEIGQRLGFSATDLYKINKLYSCPNVDLSVPPSTNTNQASVIPSSSSSTSTSVVITSPQQCPLLRMLCLLEQL
uniref:Peptidase M12A domain-containing protein n=1 Tax=Ditylenchus dipsaci TaxID=166011 RepID=A0A915CR14_9BILA